MTAQSLHQCGFTVMILFIMYIKKLLKKSVYTLIIYNLHANRPIEELQGLYYSPVTLH